MNNNNIVIDIRDGQATKNTQVQTVDSPTKHSPETQSVVGNSKVAQAAAIALAKRAIMDHTSRIGDRTGQRSRQASIDNAMSIAGIGMNLLIGAKVGGVVGFGVAAAYSGYQSITASIDIMRKREEEESRRDYYRSYAIMANRSNRSGGSL